MQGDQILLVLEKRGMHYNIKIRFSYFLEKIFIEIAVVIL